VKIKIVKSSSGTSVSIMTALRLGQPAYCKSNSKRCFSSPKLSARLCSPPNLLFNAHRGPLPALKRSGCDVNYWYLPSARIKNRWSYTCNPPSAFMACTGTISLSKNYGVPHCEIVSPVLLLLSCNQKLSQAMRFHIPYIFTEQIEKCNAYSTAAVHLHHSI